MPSSAVGKAARKLFSNKPTGARSRPHSRYIPASQVSTCAAPAQPQHMTALSIPQARNKAWNEDGEGGKRRRRGNNSIIISRRRKEWQGYHIAGIKENIGYGEQRIGEDNNTRDLAKGKLAEIFSFNSLQNCMKFSILQQTACRPGKKGSGIYWQRERLPYRSHHWKSPEKAAKHSNKFPTSWFLCRAATSQSKSVRVSPCPKTSCRLQRNLVKPGCRSSSALTAKFVASDAGRPKEQSLPTFNIQPSNRHVSATALFHGRRCTGGPWQWQSIHHSRVTPVLYLADAHKLSNGFFTGLNGVLMAKFRI